MDPNQSWPRCLLTVFFAALRIAVAQYYPPPPPVAGIVIKPDPPLLNAMVGTPYSVTFTATGGNGPYVWSVTSGGLPPGTKLDPAAGIVSGTPSVDGAFVFGLQATDSQKANTTRVYTITVRQALTITTSSPLASGAVRVNYSVTLNASGGYPAYTWSAGPGLPGGLTLNASNGALSGTPTTPGGFTFSVKVTDTSQFSTTKTFTITISSGAQLLTSVGSLAFSAGRAGDSPLAQTFLVTSTDQSGERFTVQIDGGASGAPAPPWISVTPRAGLTPAPVTVALDSSALGVAAYSARVLVVSSDGSQTIPLPVTLALDTRSPTLEVTPDYLGIAATGQPVETELLVRNVGGGGSIGFQASVPDSSAWLTVTPASGGTVTNGLVTLHVIANPAGVAGDVYRGTVRISSDPGVVDVPVQFAVTPAGPALGLSQTGLRFDARQSQGPGNTQTVNILNVGDGTANWSAELLKGQDWLSLTPTSGQMMGASPGTLAVAVNPGALAAGPYYAMIRISDPQALNSPQYLRVVLNLLPVNTVVAPELTPAGMVFTTVAGSAAPLAQALRIYASSAAPIPFQVSAVTSDGTGWLAATPAVGMTSSGQTAQVNVTANAANLKSGIYSGAVTVSLAGGATRSASVTLIVVPAGTGPLSKGQRQAACAPTRLSLTQTGLVNLFNVLVAWPQPLACQVADDCGNPVIGAQVVVSFSNGDPPLALKLSDPRSALYTGTWLPGTAGSPVSVTAHASAAGFAAVSAQVGGSAIANKAPVLKVNGTLHAFNPVTAAPLAPGTIVRMLGSNLAPASQDAGEIPLPESIGDVGVLVGGFAAPLFSVSPDRIDAHLPVELTPGRQYQVVAAVGAAFTQPETIGVTAVQPGVSASADGQAIAQHGDATPVTLNAPAAPGELITVFLAGLGATDTPVGSGQPAPEDPPAMALTSPVASLGGAPADVLSAGLVPRAVGLYSVVVRVPADAAAGNLQLVIVQSGVTANVTTLPVGP